MKTGFILAIVSFLSLEAAAQSPPPSDAPPDLTALPLEQLMDVEVVRAASRFEQKTREAPAMVTVVTAAEIRQFGWRTLDEILRSVRSLYITNDRNYAYIGVRGLSRPGDYNSRLLILIDGHRINENIFESALVEGGFPLDVDLIERIEVVRGPGSSLYGANAFFGVVNVVTKARQDVGRIEVGGSAASFGTYGGRLTAGASTAGGLEAFASGSIFSAKGQTLVYPEFDSPETPGGVIAGADGEKFQSLFGKFSWQGVTLEAAWANREKVIPTGSYGTIPGDTRNRATDENWYLDVSTTRKLGRDLEFSARASYNRSAYDEDYVYVGSPDVVNHDVSRGTWWGGEAVLGYSGVAGHRFLLGVELQDNLRQHFANYDVDPYTLWFTATDDSVRWAAFAQDEWRVSKALLLNLGARWDHYSTFGHRVSPRLAAVLMPNDATTVKLVLGSAFRAPSAYEREYEVPLGGDSGQKKNLDLEPETIKSGELAVERFFGDNLQVRVMGFAYRIDGLVSLRRDPGDGALQYQNADIVDGKGVEAAVIGRWKRISARLSLSFQDLRYAGSDAWLSNSPRELGKLHLTIPLYRDRLSAGVEALYAGRRSTLSGQALPRFALTNLTLLSSSLLPGLSVSATVTNLFDQTYSDPASEEHVQDSIRQDGRAFRVRAVVRF
jgi:iron complex outermembrane receptor protein